MLVLSEMAAGNELGMTAKKEKPQEHERGSSRSALRLQGSGLLAALYLQMFL